ncbi:Pyruvate flavodoxin/ferredoxin oxidoreductase-like protein [Candidatus Sulfotelmatobacter kueseliae]|uniref:Pyruvate flavodoxin/ferredoxin oxidoreductase-like protein n=1 Tax=Candidatus Sulfotelmatobacter kueseliae TaxID=2042962 RepID=A0A2U3K270_9BACT|nr:Pyruvate flavodoxin/ferredoxin oxidoreductase-like protein [Candidatus Sulfotelmatobacter kueseliae]
MATTDVVPRESAGGLGHKRIVNDMSIQVATVNGSGSQSSNTVLLRSIFQMGVPVSGKNMFPSNIAGLPTWYTIRANKNGYIGRKKEIDFLVAMNPETAVEDTMSLAPGASVLYDEPLALHKLRNDLVFYSVPYDKIVAAVCPEAKLRKLVKNMVYVGVVAKLLTIEMAEIEKAIRKQFAKKAKAANLNLAAAQAGFEYAKSNLEKRGAFYIERMDKTAGKIIIDGNSAAALGCMFAGCTVVTWYPITPSSSLVETMIEYMKEYRIGPDGKATFAIVQAEDELAAIGMVIGAGWAGARSMTATAGPGISLMSEFAGLAYYVEVPGVIWDIQRVGPSTGLPTRTSQGDILSTAVLSHGDTKHIMLIPCSVEECFTMATDAFNLAEQFQTLVFVMSDLDLGMNNWMSDPFPYPTAPIQRGKVLSKEDLDRLGGFARYKDVDGDGIGYRTLPGTQHPAAAYFARGSGHNEKAQYSERADDFENNLERLNRKFETARSFVPRPEISKGNNAGGEKVKTGIIGYGTSHWGITESRDQLRDEYKIETDYLRLRAYPFTREVHDFIEQHERIYVVEQNRDAQMLSLLKLDVKPELTTRLRSIAHITGLPLDARSITDELTSMEGK